MASLDRSVIAAMLASVLLSTCLLVNTSYADELVNETSAVPAQKSKAESAENFEKNGTIRPPTRTYQAPPKRNARGTWSFGGYLNRLSVDNEGYINPFTERLELGDEAFSLGFRAEYLMPIDLSLAFQIGFINFEDNSEFYQDVYDYWGYAYTEESDVHALHFEFDIGPQYFFGPKGALSISPRVGFMTVLGEERSITNCSFCYEEDLDISGGVSFGIDARADVGSFLIGVSGRGYAQGDINSSISLNMQTHF